MRVPPRGHSNAGSNALSRTELLINSSVSLDSRDTLDNPSTRSEGPPSRHPLSVHASIRRDLAARLEHALERAQRLANGQEHACLLYGSTLAEHRWLGSDINVAVIIDGLPPCVPAVTAYLYDDIKTPNPRIETWYDGTRFLRIEVLPRALVRPAALDDWILADRLAGARILAGEPSWIASDLAQVRGQRFRPAVRERRVRWYVARARDYLAGAASARTAADRHLDLYVAAMFLAYATLERAALGKGSYKRLPHCLRAAEPIEPNAALARELLDVDGRDFAHTAQLVQSCREALPAFHRYALDLLSDGFGAERVPSTTRYTFMSSLRPSGDGLPYGCGVVESLACGDPGSALDSLRKTVLWFLLMSAHLGCVRGDISFDRYNLLSFCSERIGLPERATEHARVLWHSDAPARAARLAALSDCLAPLAHPSAA